MAHDHGHDHTHAGRAHHHPTGSGTRLIIGIVLNLIITIAQVIGGIVSGSLALLSDAVHNLSDTISLGVSYGAQRVGRREANARKTFGYRRAEVLAAFVNLATLIGIGAFLIWEAVERFLDPQPVDGPLMLTVALVGLAANVATAFLLHGDAKDSLNIRSAYLHILGDALSSVGVVLGGVLVWQFGWTWVDPAVTLLVAAYLIVHSWSSLRHTVDILMESTPRGLDLGALARAMEADEAVAGVHHLHAWTLGEGQRALEAHVLLTPGSDATALEPAKRRLKHTLRHDFAIAHSTLEFEFEPCDEIHDAHGGTFDPARPAQC